MADKTRTELKMQARISLALVGPDGQLAAFSAWAYVIPTGCASADVTLGMPTLIQRAGKVFLDILKELADKHGKSTDEPVRVGSDSSARTAAGRVPKASTHHRRPSSRIVRHYLTTSTRTGAKVSKKFFCKIERVQ
jgi:hypothetical protein